MKSEERLWVPERAVDAAAPLGECPGNGQSRHIAKDDSYLISSVGDSIFIVRNISGQILNYEAVLPKSTTITVTLNAAARREASRAAAAPSETSESPTVTLPEHIRSCFSADLASADSDLG